MTDIPVSPLRRRMVEDMTIRKFAPKTQASYIRAVRNFTVFLGPLAGPRERGGSAALNK
jgi:integrase/recombinase XerD